VRPKASWAGLICRTHQHYHHHECQALCGQIPDVSLSTLCTKIRILMRNMKIYIVSNNWS